MRTAQTWEKLPSSNEMLEAFEGLPVLDKHYRAVWLMSRKTYADMQAMGGGNDARWPRRAWVFGKPVRFVDQKGISLCVRDMPAGLRFTPKRRAA